MVDGDVARDCKTTTDETIDTVEGKSAPARVLDRVSCLSIGVKVEIFTHHQYKYWSAGPVVLYPWES